MFEQNGARRQNMMQENPGVSEADYSAKFPVRGAILATRYAEVGGIRRTLVDCYLVDKQDGTKHEYLIGVPLMYTKMNKHNGEEWTPEKGDMVVIGFFNGNWRDPFVMGYLGGADTDIYTPLSATPRYYRKRSGTDEEVDEEGNRTVNVAKDDTLVIEGFRNIHIKGATTAPALNILVEGNAVLTVTEDITASCKNFNLTASESIVLTTPSYDLNYGTGA